jgi:hypothetical protein
MGPSLGQGAMRVAEVVGGEITASAPTRRELFAELV